MPLLQTLTEVIREGLLEGARAGGVGFELPLEEYIGGGDVEFALEFAGQVGQRTGLGVAETFMGHIARETDTDGIVIR